jgi:hypothetical protein
MTEEAPVSTITPNRLSLLIAFGLFIVAALAAFGVIHASAEGFALGGFAFWALSGAL